MSILATNISSIPKEGYDWYVTFIEFNLESQLKVEIEEYFHKLGKELGPKAIAIRGYDEKQFRESVFEVTALFDAVHETSLIVTNKNPELAFSSEQELSDTKAMIFPLGDLFEKQKTIVPFLKDLVNALANNDFVAVEKRLENATEEELMEEIPALRKAWNWLRKYTDMNPGFFGFNIRLGDLIENYVFKQ